MHTDEAASRGGSRRVLFGIISAVLFAGLGFRAFTDPVPEEKLRRLRKGMSQDEVRVVLGNPIKVYAGQWTYQRALVFGYVNLHWLPDGSFDGEVNYERF